jgi:Holliday junction resolvase
MVDSRVKGQRGEYLVRDLLRERTGLKFERVPSSGALAYLKGDLYIPDAKNVFCIEVKNYEKSPLTDKVFTNKTNYLVLWWAKLIEQAEAKNQEPLLFFKYSRSKIFVGTKIKPETTNYFLISWLECYIMLAEEWLDNESVKFTHD